MSTQGSAEDIIRRASAQFTRYNPRTGRTEDGEKAPLEFRIQRQPMTDETRERLRAMALGREAKRRADFETHCRRGHEWTEETAKISKCGVRVCRVCERASHARTRRRKAARKVAA